MASDIRARILAQGHRLSVWTVDSANDQQLRAQETGLCNVCTCFLKEVEGRRHLWRPHQKTPRSLAEAVRHGCVMCSELWHGFDPDRIVLDQPSHAQWEEWKTIDHPQLFVIGWYTYEAEDSFSMCLSVDSPKRYGVERTFISVKRLPPAEEISQAEQFLKLPSLQGLSSTGNPDVMSKALQWIRKCEAHHSCAGKGTSSWLPSRLVDVCPPGGQQLFRIVSPAAESISAPYLTLSHCWGGSEGILKLVKSNYTQLQAGMDKSALPPTFRDAMDVCFQLNLRYIWIDSLCIIQDDALDWAAETESMCHVYKNALCNIAATANSNSSMSLFRQRQRRVVSPLQVTISKSVSSQTIIAAGTYSMIHSRLWLSGIESQPLNRRAWVFQERLLSPRTLHFSHNQLIWECSEMATTESYPNSSATSLHKQHNKTLVRGGVLGDVKSCDSSDEECSFCREWYSLVFGFSSGTLTFSDDRPKAILGLAKELEELYQTPYVLGMFQGHLRRQILWWSPDRPSYLDLTNSKPIQRKLPTFSWLSLDSRISTFHWYPTTWLYEIIQLHLHDESAPSAHDPQSTSLEIKCSPVRIYLANFSEEEESKRLLSTSKDGYVLQETYTWPDFGRPDLPSSSEGREHYIVPMKMQESTSYTIVECLILERVRDGSDVFRRIGYLHSKDPALRPPGEREPEAGTWEPDAAALKTIALV